MLSIAIGKNKPIPLLGGWISLSSEENKKK